MPFARHSLSLCIHCLCANIHAYLEAWKLSVWAPGSRHNAFCHPDQPMQFISSSFLACGITSTDMTAFCVNGHNNWPLVCRSVTSKNLGQFVFYPVKIDYAVTIWFFSSVFLLTAIYLPVKMVYAVTVWLCSRMKEQLVLVLPVPMVSWWRRYRPS